MDTCHAPYELDVLLMAETTELSLDVVVIHYIICLPRSLHLLLSVSRQDDTTWPRMLLLSRINAFGLILFVPKRGV